MRALIGAATLAALCTTLPYVQAQDRQEMARPPVERNWSELIDAASRELEITILYDGQLARQRIAVSTGRAPVSSRALLEQLLALHRMELEVDLEARVGRISRYQRPPVAFAAEVVEVRHADAVELAAMINGLKPERGSWVRARSAPGTSAIALAGSSALVEQARNLIVTLDRPPAEKK